MIALAAGKATRDGAAAAPSASAGPGAAAMQSLKERLAGLQALVPEGRPVLYLDYPVHLNVGDQLINLGTECYLRDHRHHVIGRYSLFNCPSDIARRIPGDAVILLNGGGNLGDVYVDHEAFRQRIVAECPRHRIVVLPQTIRFVAAAAQATAAANYGRHADLTICVRDQRSAEVAAALGATPLLLPDMAHQLWRHPELQRLRRPMAVAQGRLRFFRKDDEAAERWPATDAATDWGDWQGGSVEFAFRGLRKLHHLAPRLPGSGRLAGLWYRFRDALIAGALRRLGNPAVVETDRLHMSILATLLGIPVDLFDNSYGKNAGYAEAWFAGHGGVHYRGRRQA